MFGLVSLWSHALAAMLYAALALSQLRYWNGDARNRPLVAAFAVTSAWAGAAAAVGPQHLLPLLLASGRTFAFLSFMYALLRNTGNDERHQAVKAVYFTVAAVLGLQIAFTGVIAQVPDHSSVVPALESTRYMLGLAVAAGSLVLVHNVYGQAAPDRRSSLRLPVIGLAGMWIYELQLNTVGYLSGDPIADLYAMQGAILAMLVPAFAMAGRRDAVGRIQLSRAATFQSISSLGILAYLVLMMSATRVLEIFGGHWTRIGQVGVVFALTIAALIFMGSGKARAWLRVTLVKHLFQHRYDYRAEWLRFTRTMGVSGENAAPIETRVIQAIADIGDSPAGLLLVPDGQYRLAFAASWNWPALPARGHAGEAEFARFLETNAHIVEFGEVRGGRLAVGRRGVAVPAWMLAEDRAWAGIPLIHNERLVGVVVLAHPLLRRPLDWEDYDLFRTAGKQAASYLAEARSHDALADAQRFDEFNRRFAFIMHDIKNVVSQLSLVAHNAERHADNPEFRADMVATLQSSVRKMNDLLARLSRGNRTDGQLPRAIAVQQIIGAVVEAKRRAHPLRVVGASSLAAVADPVRLEQAVAHLVQNAIDASPKTIPVRIAVDERDGEVAIDIRDEGAGMSAEFIRTRLFQPFASTKDGGFGIGAFEARALVESMDGRLDVESREGEGTCFTIFLPAAETCSAPAERKRA